MSLTARPILCLVTSLRYLDERAPTPVDRPFERLVDRIRQAAASGVSLVQIREPQLGASELLLLVQRAVEAVRGTPCRVVVNDRLDVALAAGAHGVHLRADSFAPERIRARWPSALIGCSVHSLPEVARCAGAGAADYLVFGTVFPSSSKAAGHPAAGVEALASVVYASSPLPVLAIGGVTLESAPAVAAAGAAGLAAIALFSGSAGNGPPLHEIVRRLRETFQNPSAGRADNISGLPSGHTDA